MRGTRLAPNNTTGGERAGGVMKHETDESGVKRGVGRGGEIEVCE